MDRDTIIVMDWMALVLLVPAVIILIWMMVSDKRKAKPFSSDLTTAALVLGLAVIGVSQLNVRSWILVSVALLLVQLLLLVALYKRLWSPLMRKLHG